MINILLQLQIVGGEMPFENISEQIQLLKQHPNVSKVEQVNFRSYKLIYRPSELTCHYSLSEYRLLLELPQHYPHSPPSLKFLDQIDHHQINKNNGIVNMDLLKDDWSPYIYLSSIIDNLQILLSESPPETDYQIKIHKVQTNSSHKIKKSLTHEGYQEIKVMEANQNKHNTSRKFSHLSEESVELQMFDIMGIKSNMTKTQKHLPLNMDLPNEKDFQMKPSPIREKLIQIPSLNFNDVSISSIAKSNAHQIETYSRQKTKSKKIKQQNILVHKLKRFKSIDALTIQRKQSQEKQSTKKYLQTNQLKITKRTSLISKQQKTMKQCEELKEIDQIKIKLAKVNATIELFIVECCEIQNHLQKTTSSTLRKILNEKHGKQVKMIEDLEEIAQQFKKKILEIYQQELKEINIEKIKPKKQLNQEKNNRKRKKSYSDNENENEINLFKI